MNILNQKEITFKDLERFFFEMGCKIAKGFLQEFLEQTDKQLAENRNKKELRHGGKKITTLKTLMGEVTVKRNVYRKTDENGQVQHMYLLDQFLGFETIGLISPNLAEKILELSCQKSYRQVAQTISELTNQTISHQGVWDVIQTAGQRQKKAEYEEIKAYKNHQLNGTKEVPVLFEEADGVWLSMQGRSGKKRGNGRKELKIGIAYEGWAPRYPSSQEYKTIGKMVYAGYHKPSEFQELREAKVATKYNVDEIKYRILNGDGAAWIKHAHDPETGVFQLDPYHLSQSIVRNVSDKKARYYIKKWLKTHQFDRVYEKIEKLRYECGGLISEIKKLNNLETYIRNNEDGIISYKDKKELDIPTPPQGLEYRNLGTMEKNVDLFAKRMKGAKSWSEEGASNLARIIALKMSGDFKYKIAALVSGRLSERFAECFKETITNTKGIIDKSIKNNIYPLQRGTIPFTGCKMTNGRRAIRNIFNIQDFNSLTYR